MPYISKATLNAVYGNLQNVFADCYHDNRFDFDEDAFDDMARALQDVATLLDIEPLAEGISHIENI